MTGSGQARRAGLTLRRLVLRLLLLAGFTGAAWLASVLLAGTASADIRIEVPGVTTINVNTPKPATVTRSDAPSKPAVVNTTKSTKSTSQSTSTDQGGLGGLVGGLVGGLTNTVTNTVTTVTSTVNQTLDTVTTTVTNTLDTVTTTVNKTVDTVTKTTEKVLPPAGNGGTGGGTPLLPNDPIGGLLNPNHTNGSSQATAPRAETPAPAAAPVVMPEIAPVAIEPAPVIDRPRVRIEPHTTRSAAHPVRVGSSQEKAAPAGNSPGPLPSPSAPAAPVAPCPTYSSGNNTGSDARGMLAVLTPLTTLVPPSAGWLQSHQMLAQLGRAAGLPATPPD